METSKLESLINKVNEKKAEANLNRQIAFNERMMKYAEELAKWNEKIREWKKDINILIANGFAFYDEDFWRFRDKPYKERERIDACTIGTDCIYHTFGIYKSVDWHSGRMPSDCGDLGVAQGGACGDWHIHTDGTQWWIQKGSQIAELRERDYEDLFRKFGDEKLNKLERFERKMNNLYAYLEKCAA